MLIDLDEDEAEHVRQNVAWLETAGPDDWHRVALDFNWGEPHYLLDWIVRQDQCDAATALTIFWQGEPEAWMAEGGADAETPNGFSYLNRQICIYVAERVQAGGYERSEIAFAPTTWTKKAYVDLLAREQTLENPNFRTDPALIRGRSGREVDLNAAFYQRYPEAFHFSYFDEQLSADLERGAYETPRSRELTRSVDAVEQKVIESLPDWLRDDQVPDVPDQPAAENALAPPEPPPVGREILPPSKEALAIESDASVRVRAMRHRVEADDRQGAAEGKPSGVIGWLRRLFGR